MAAQFQLITLTIGSMAQPQMAQQMAPLAAAVAAARVALAETVDFMAVAAVVRAAAAMQARRAETAVLGLS